MAGSKKYSATIVRDKGGVYHIRISTKGPQIGGDVEVIEVLFADTEAEIKKKAFDFVEEYEP